MTVRYHVRDGRLFPDYLCQREGIENAQPLCQQIPGRGIDEAIGQLLVEAVSPVALEVALTVQQELQSRLEDADRLRLKQVEASPVRSGPGPPALYARRSGQPIGRGFARGRVEQQTAYAHRDPAGAGTPARTRPTSSQRRTTGSDSGPGYRLPTIVARSKHARPGTQAHDPTISRRRHTESCRKHHPADPVQRRGDEDADSGPTPQRVAAARDQSRSDQRDRPLTGAPNLFQIASTLNGRALLSGEGKPFTSHIIARIRREYGLASRYDRLRKAGMLTLREMAALLGITPQWVRIWHRNRHPSRPCLHRQE